jgi:hypothetical protein
MIAFAEVIEIIPPISVMDFDIIHMPDSTVLPGFFILSKCGSSDSKRKDKDAKHHR